MAKILFTADLHIKLGQKNVPIDWAKNRFDLFLEQIDAIQDRVDLVVVGGDIFDRFPDKADEIELYFKLVDVFRKPTVFYDGNHEAIGKSKTFLEPLKYSTTRINKLVNIVTDFQTVLDGTVDVIPYNKLKGDYPDTLQANILCTHVRGEIPPHVKPEVDLDVFNKWDVVLAGDLHNYDNCQRNILYPGSPYTTSFHRRPVDTGVIVLDTDSLEHDWIKLKLPQLLKYTVKVNEEMPAGEFDHIMYEVEGNLQDLSKLDDSPLISKVLVDRLKDSSLLLSNDMKIGDELREYLIHILEVPDYIAESVIKEFHDNEAKLGDIL